MSESGAAKPRGRSSLLGRGGIAVIGTSWNSASKFAVNALIGRVAGAAVLGEYATTLALANMLFLLGPASTGPAASKHVAQADGRGDVAGRAAVAHFVGKIVVILAVALSVVGVFVYYIFVRADPMNAMVVALVVIGLSGWAAARGILFGEDRVRRAVVLDVVTGTSVLLAVILLLLTGHTNAGVLLIPLGAAYVAYVAYARPFRRAAPLSRYERRRIVGFVALGTVGTVASAGFIQSTILGARVVAGSEGAGFYSAAMALAVPANLVSSALSLVMFPALARLTGSGAGTEFRQTVTRTLKAVIFLAVPVFGLLMLYGGHLILWVWGPNFSPATNLLPILLLGVLATTCTVPVVNALTARSNRGMAASAGSSVVGAVLGTTVWVTTSGSLGLTGVALGYLVGATINCVFPVIIVWNRGGYRWGWTYVRLVAALVTLAALTFSDWSRSSEGLVPFMVFTAAWVAAHARGLLSFALKARRGGTSGKA